MWFKLSAASWLLLLLVGCQQTIDLEAPPEILYGQDVCDECNMIINDPRFAAAYVTADGEVRRFDDIGGMLSHDQKVGEAAVVYWVHDFSTEAWLDAREAYFVLDNQELITPMGWGIAAFSSESAAADYVSAHSGSVTTYATLQEQIQSGQIDPSQFGDNQSGDHDHEQEMEMDQMEMDQQ
jgi:copper chaperone NosL